MTEDEARRITEAVLRHAHDMDGPAWDLELRERIRARGLCSANVATACQGDTIAIGSCCYPNGHRGDHSNEPNPCEELRDLCAAMWRAGVFRSQAAP